MTHRPASRDRLRVTADVMADIEKTVGARPAESGGMLGGDPDDAVVRHYYFDTSGRSTGATYSPDHVTINRLLAQSWNPAKIRLMGFVHSHPGNYSRPSPGDVDYVSKIFAANPEMERFLLPIVRTKPDSGTFELVPFGVFRDGDAVRVEEMGLEVLPNRNESSLRNRSSALDEERVVAGGEDVSRYDVTAVRDRAFSRVCDAYDLELMDRARVVCVGCGGAAGFLEDLARAGVGEFILVDRDTVATENIGTQQVYRRDVGRLKGDAIADRLRDINPRCAVVCVPTFLEELSDDDIRALLARELRGPRPERALLCGCTDNFNAQSRVNRLALTLGVPSLCAQVYAEGRGGEVTFTSPGVTPACHRCALSARYKAYLDEDYVNDVTSRGTPIFATTRLNALKGQIALALLHHGSAHPRWGRMLERIGNRNLVLIRMDPDFQLPAFDRALAGASPERLFCDDVAWLPQLADGPPTGFPACPDCGGSGDLRNAIGSINDTRMMRR